MNNDQLQRTLRLLRRTGDRGIVLDPASDEVFVLMDADSYEKMLTAEHSTGKDDRPHMDDYVLDDLLEIEELAKDGGTAVVKQEAVKEKNEEKPAKILNFNEDWDKKSNPIINEESLADVPHEEEVEEKFYLEPVE